MEIMANVSHLQIIVFLRLKSICLRANVGFLAHNSYLLYSHDD